MKPQPPYGPARRPEGPSSPKLALDDATIEAIACRVAELLGGSAREPTGLVDAATLARVLGISRATVYANASKLGAMRLGDVGEDKRPRLRFDVDTARAAMTSGTSSRQPESPQSPTASGKPRGRRRGRTGTSVALLPIEPPTPLERKAS